MFKLVVLCAFAAAVVAEPEPQVLLGPWAQPYSAYSTVVSPGLTSYSQSSSSVINPVPLGYSASIYNAQLPFTHLIKKRSADPQLLGAPVITPSTYLASNAYSAPWNLNPYLQTPTFYTNAQLPLATHFIKKRSADPQLLVTPSVVPTAYYANNAYAAPWISTPYLQAPTVYSAATLPLASTHLIKKRSADPEPKPQLLPITPTTYFGGAPIISPYNSPANIINPNPYIANPYLATNPFVYSSFIKK